MRHQSDRNRRTYAIGRQRADCKAATCASAGARCAVTPGQSGIHLVAQNSDYLRADARRRRAAATCARCRSHRTTPGRRWCKYLKMQLKVTPAPRSSADSVVRNLPPNHGSRVSRALARHDVSVESRSRPFVTAYLPAPLSRAPPKYVVPCIDAIRQELQNTQPCPTARVRAWLSARPAGSDCDRAVSLPPPTAPSIIFQPFYFPRTGASQISFGAGALNSGERLSDSHDVVSTPAVRWGHTRCGPQYCPCT